MVSITIYIINIVYTILVSVICSYSFRVNHRKKVSGESIYGILILIGFSLVMCLRASTVGVDTDPYTRIYSIIGNSGSYFDALSKAPLSGPVYIFISWVLYHISTDPQILTIVTSLFVNIGLYKYIEKASKDQVVSYNCWIGLTLFYCSMNGNRQCMALVLMLNALYYLSEDLLSKRGWILFILAVGIHSTAIIAIIAVVGIFVANKIKENRTLFLASFGVSVVISFILSKFVTYFVRFFPRYEMYTIQSSTHYIFSNTGGGRIVILYLFLLGITLLWIFANKKNSMEEEPFHTKMLPAIVFGVVFGIFNSKNELLNRMLWFFISLFVTFIPETIRSYKGTIKYAIKYGILIGLYAYSFISLLENQNGVVPYEFFWQ